MYEAKLNLRVSVVTTDFISGNPTEQQVAIPQNKPIDLRRFKGKDRIMKSAKYINDLMCKELEKYLNPTVDPTGLKHIAVDGEFLADYIQEQFSHYAVVPYSAPTIILTRVGYNQIMGGEVRPENAKLTFVQDQSGITHIVTGVDA